MDDGRRKHKFIDATVQGRLLFALIGLELFLFTIAIFWLHHELSTIVEQNLYRVHYSNHEGAATLSGVVFMVVALVFVVNVIALWIADYIWRRYINSVVCVLKDILSGIGEMNFSKSSMHIQTDHDVLDKALQWKMQEQQYYSDIKEAISILPDEINPADENSIAQVEKDLEKLQSLIAMAK